MSETDGVAAYEARMAEERKRWPRGPWDNEPNRVAFEHVGFPCIIQRGGGGSWCGYVGVPPGHPLHGKGYGSAYDESADIYIPSPVSDLSVHGGITYAEKCQGGVCHVPKPGEPEDVWWLGFDCCHYGDDSPGRRTDPTAFYASLDPYLSYKTQSYVTCETERLAEQLRRVAEGKPPEEEDPTP